MKTFQEMCARYGISKSTFSGWLKNNRALVDSNGQHIANVGKKLYFDDFAVAKIDKLRGFDLEPIPENERLRQENLKLQEELLTLQRKLKAIVEIVFK